MSVDLAIEAQQARQARLDLTFIASSKRIAVPARMSRHGRVRRCGQPYGVGFGEVEVGAHLQDDLLVTAVTAATADRC